MGTPYLTELIANFQALQIDTAASSAAQPAVSPKKGGRTVTKQADALAVRPPLGGKLVSGDTELVESGDAAGTNRVVRGGAWR